VLSTNSCPHRAAVAASIEVARHPVPHHEPERAARRLEQHM